MKEPLPTPLTDEASTDGKVFAEFAKALEIERFSLLMAIKGLIECTRYVTWVHTGATSVPYHNCAACGSSWKLNVGKDVKTKEKHKPACRVLGHRFVIEAIDPNNVHFGASLTAEGFVRDWKPEQWDQHFAKGDQ